MPRVVVTFPLREPHIAQLRAVDPSVDLHVVGSGVPGDLDRFPSELQSTIPPEEIAAELPTAEVLICFWGRPLRRMIPTAERLAERAPQLRWVQLSHVGIDTLDPSLAQTGVQFTNGAGVNTVAIAEWVIGCMLMQVKGWPGAFHAQAAGEWARFQSGELRGRTVGIVGMGDIGRETARLAKALGCRVIATRRSYTGHEPDPPADATYPPGELRALLAASDFAVLTAPGTAETRHLIGRAELDALGPRGYLLNIARGSLIDEAALAEALRDGRIAGAALDVFEQEPLPADSPLWSLRNTILTPHTSGGTERYFDRLIEICCDNLRRYVDGTPLRNIVDPGRGY